MNGKKYGTKERLFEMMYRVNSLNEKSLSTTNFSNIINEDLLSRGSKREIIIDFIKFVDEKLKFGKDLPKIHIDDKEGVAKKNKSFGGYMPSTKEIFVVSKNRNLADVLRSLAHELVHHKQNLDNRLDLNSGKTGSDIENEANSIAGVLMRDYGKINPNIFE